MRGAGVLSDLPSIETLIPHRPPMRMLDHVVSFDADSSSLVCARSVVESPLCRGGQMRPAALIEHMAQAAAACTGLLDAGVAGAAARGYLVGVPSLDVSAELISVGDALRIRAARVSSAGLTASFECVVERDGQVLATARLLVVREEKT